MNENSFKKGQYAELMAEYTEHIFRDEVSKTERNYKFLAPEGALREVDVCTTLLSGEMIALESRDRKSTQSIDWIDQIIGKYIDSPFAKKWVCTFDGCKLSSEAIKKLEHYNIGWRDFTLMNDNLNGKPILTVYGVVIDMANSSLLVNGEAYQDLQYSYDQNGTAISYKEMHFEMIDAEIRKDFSVIKQKDFLTIKETVTLGGIHNNIDKEEIEIELTHPLRHKVYVDFFDESYVVRNDKEEDVLLSSKNKSVFITKDTLVINFSYLYSFEENVIMDRFVRIDLSSLPEEYRNINKVKFVDVEGEGKVIPMKLYGLKYENGISSDEEIL